MKQRKTTPCEVGLRKALSILDRFSPKELIHSNDEWPQDSDLGDQLLQRLNFLLDERRNTLSKLEQVEKELVVFRNVNSEASKLLERQIEELSLLRLVTDASTHAMLARDPFKFILDKVISIIGADFGFLTVLNPETAQFELRTLNTSDGEYSEDSLAAMAAEITEKVAPAGGPLRIDDLRANQRFSALADVSPMRSLASFPLIVDEKKIGVLTVGSQHADAFDAETERIMHIIAGQAAVTVQNALLYAEVKKTKEYLENLVDRAGDAIFTLDRSHTIVSWNAGAQTIFKRKKEEAVGRFVYDLVAVDAAAGLKAHVDSVLNSEDIVTIETEALRYDGEAAQIALTLSPIRNADGEVIGISGIAKDITEHKRVEEELRRLNAVKSQFVSTVSHELRTPLTSIKSYVQILLHEMNALPEDTVHRYFTIMNEECDRLAGLITNVLDLQKLEAGLLETRLEPLLLADVVRQVKELFISIAVPNRIELTSEFIAPDPMTKILGDNKRLRQILSNLLSNAFKFARPSGRVGIIVTRDNEGVHVIVSDDGIGIPACEVEKIFEKFYQVDNEVTRAKGGTGLGLAITKELVALHHGRIWVVSEEGKGCNFHIAFPAAD